MPGAHVLLLMTPLSSITIKTNALYFCPPEYALTAEGLNSFSVRYPVTRAASQLFIEGMYTVLLSKI